MLNVFSTYMQKMGWCSSIYGNQSRVLTPDDPFAMFIRLKVWTSFFCKCWMLTSASLREKQVMWNEWKSHHTLGTA